MKKQKLKYYKELLIKEKEDILKTLNLMEDNEPNSSMKNYFDELSMYDNHPADLGTEMFMIEHSMGLKSSEAYILNKIDKALERIEDQNYGVCIECGKEINEERLKILPYTDVCINCSSKNEKLPLDNKKKLRPQEEENLMFPFGSSNKDYSFKKSVEFDREDSLQSVLKYNEVIGDPSFSTGDHQGVFDDKELGIVEEVEGISEEYYKNQLKEINEEYNSNK